mmetsp:Transcript_21237/g.63280  ORF Transcript_21237/g.63280 Transcript_21237/m.63280 type:complete len:219 (-) Transcript_21237:52-708(-)
MRSGIPDTGILDSTKASVCIRSEGPGRLRGVGVDPGAPHRETLARHGDVASCSPDRDGGVCSGRVHCSGGDGPPIHGKRLNDAAIANDAQRDGRFPGKHRRGHGGHRARHGVPWHVAAPRRVDSEDAPRARPQNPGDAFRIRMTRRDRILETTPVRWIGPRRRSRRLVALFLALTALDERPRLAVDRVVPARRLAFGGGERRVDAKPVIVGSGKVCAR